MNCSPPGSSVHGIFQARVLVWVAIAFSEKKMPQDESKKKNIIADLDVVKAVLRGKFFAANTSFRKEVINNKISYFR